MNYDGRVILAAHRGDRKRYPENTVPAFLSAIELGADMIETDIRMTRDKELVIIHDASPLRTTGTEGIIGDMTLAEVKKLDAAWQFSPEMSNVRIPTVEEFIELILPSGIQVNWEIKDYPEDRGDAFAFETTDKLLDKIHKYGLADRSMLNSFSDRILERVYSASGGELCIHGQGIGACSRSKDISAVERERLYDWCCLYPNIKGDRPLDYPENFAYCNERGILPCVCVPDEIESYKQYIELGCRMFTSNDIVAADRILRELGER